MRISLLTIYCGVLMSLSAFSIDIMLPAFAEIEAELNAPTELVQATVPAFVFAFAMAHIFCGPASDRFGRKPVVTFGLAVFAAGAILSSFAGSIEALLVGRAIQGAGAATGPVVGRAILRDRFSGPQLATVMASAMAVFSFGPIIAPLIGYGLVAVGSWRYVFFAMTLLCLSLLLTNIFVFRETIEKKDVKATRPGSLWRSAKAVLIHPQSRTYLIFACAAYCALLTYVSNAPRLYFQAFAVSTFQFSLFFAITGLGIILGQLGNRWMLKRLGILITLRFAAGLLFTASSLSAGFAYFDTLNALGFTAVMFLFNTSFLVVVANASTLIIDPHKEIAGFTSAFFGFCSLASAAVFTSLTFAFIAGDMVRWALAMTALTSICFAGFVVIKKSPDAFAG